MAFLVRIKLPTARKSIHSCVMSSLLIRRVLGNVRGVSHVTSVEIDRKHRQSIRKLAAVLAGLLVLGMAAMATVAAWSDSADQASFASLGDGGFSPVLDVAGWHAGESRGS